MEYILAMFGFDHETRQETFSKKGIKSIAGFLLFGLALSLAETTVNFLTNIVEKII